MSNTGGTPGYVQGAPDSTGKRVESIAVVQPDGTLVYEQVVSIADFDGGFLRGVREAVGIRHNLDDGPLYVTQDPSSNWRIISQGKDQFLGGFQDLLTDTQGRQIVQLQEALPFTLGRLQTALNNVSAPLYGGNGATIFVGDVGNTAYAGLNFRVDASFDGGVTWMLSLPIAALGAVTAMTGLAATGVIANTAGGRAYVVNCPGATHVRAQATAYTSGIAYLRIQPIVQPIVSSSITISGTVPVSGTLTSAGTTTNTPAAPTMSQISSAATTNATSVKGSAGTIYTIWVSNTGGAAAYLKLYNKATAPTVGTDVPVLTITIPAGGTICLTSDIGQRFTTGIALAITNLAADSDTTAVAAAQVKVSTAYI